MFFPQVGVVIHVYAFNLKIRQSNQLIETRILTKSVLTSPQAIPNNDAPITTLKAIVSYRIGPVGSTGDADIIKKKLIYISLINDSI